MAVALKIWITTKIKLTFFGLQPAVPASLLAKQFWRYAADTDKLIIGH